MWRSDPQMPEERTVTSAPGPAGSGTSRTSMPAVVWRTARIRSVLPLLDGWCRLVGGAVLHERVGGRFEVGGPGLGVLQEELLLLGRTDVRGHAGDCPQKESAVAN